MQKRLAIVGAGSRGYTIYSKFAHDHPGLYQVTAVAEPREWYRKAVMERHGCPGFAHWKDLAEQPVMADAVVISTQDRDHVQPALRFLEMGYDVLLEKPMDVTPEGCRQIVECCRKHNRILRVSHVMRYTPIYRRMFEIIQSGVLGQICTVRHLEAVNYWHQAHSFVRGNWRRRELSAPMILAKSSHDLDLICYLLQRPCLRLSSFGHLSHFCREQMPAGAADRCLDCVYKETCPYSATAFYLGRFDAGERCWPIDVLIHEPFTREGLEDALRTGPYGRCVYKCDNDVVDHQVVSMEFKDHVTAVFTMTAFTDRRHRETEVLGSHGQLRTDGRFVRLTCFGKPQIVPPGGYEEDGDLVWDTESELTGWGGHGGGDEGLMRYFHEVLCDREAALRTTDPEESLASHLMAFAADESRLSNGQVVQL